MWPWWKELCEGLWVCWAVLPTVHKIDNITFSSEEGQGLLHNHSPAAHIGNEDISEGQMLSLSGGMSCTFTFFYVWVWKPECVFKCVSVPTSVCMSILNYDVNMILYCINKITHVYIKYFLYFHLYICESIFSQPCLMCGVLFTLHPDC